MMSPGTCGGQGAGREAAHGGAGSGEGLVRSELDEVAMMSMPFRALEALGFTPTPSLFELKKSTNCLRHGV